MVDLELGRVVEVPPRHSLTAHDELGEEGQVETDKDEQRRDLAPLLRVHPAEHLREPVVDG